MQKQNPKKPQQKSERPGGKPQSKEDAIRRIVEKDPEKAAAILREILNKR